MILAKFTEEEANIKSMQWKVSCNLVKKTEMKGKTGANETTAIPVLPIEDIGFDENNESVNKVSSMTEE